MMLPFQGKKLVSIVPKPDSDDATSPNMFKSLAAGGLKSDKKCRKVIFAIIKKRTIMEATKKGNKRFIHEYFHERIKYSE